MRIAGCLLAILTALLAGTGLTLGLWRGRQPILATELLALGWLLGAGMVSLLLAILGIGLSGGSLVVAVTVVCAFAAAYGWKGKKAGVAIESGLTGLPAWEKWFCLLALLPIVYMAFATFRDALLWDGLVIWETKARHAFLAGGALPASYFSDGTRGRYHLSYPLYLPFTELWIYLWAGDCDQAMAKMVTPIFYATAILLLWSTVFRLTGKAWAATMTAVLPVFIPLMADHGLGLVEGYVDFPLGAVYLAGIGALFVWRLNGIEGCWPVACASAALLPWIKQEGMILLACATLVAALVHGWSGWRRTVLFALPGVAILLVWRVSMHAVHAIDLSDFQPMTMETLSRNLPRLRVIFEAMYFQLTQPRSWSLLWFCVPLAVLCLAWRQRSLALWLSAALLGPLLMDVVPYYFTNLDLLFHISTSFDRLALQISLVAVLCLGLALAPPRKSVEQSQPHRD